MVPPGPFSRFGGDPISFAPSELSYPPQIPTACAVGCILSQLRGCIRVPVYAVVPSFGRRGCTRVSVDLAGAANAFRHFSSSRRLPPILHRTDLGRGGRG